MVVLESRRSPALPRSEDCPELYSPCPIPAWCGECLFLSQRLMDPVLVASALASDAGQLLAYVSSWRQVVLQKLEWGPCLPISLLISSRCWYPAKAA